MKNLLHCIRLMYMMFGVFILSGCISNNDKSPIDKLCDSDSSGICKKLPLDEPLCAKPRFELITLQLENDQSNSSSQTLTQLKHEQTLLKSHKTCLYDEYRKLPIFQSTYRGKLKQERDIMVKELTEMEAKIKKAKLESVDVSRIYLSGTFHVIQSDLVTI